MLYYFDHQAFGGPEDSDMRRLGMQDANFDIFLVVTFDSWFSGISPRKHWGRQGHLLQRKKGVRVLPRSGVAHEC